MNSRSVFSWLPVLLSLLFVVSCESRSVPEETNSPTVQVVSETAPEETDSPPVEPTPDITPVAVNPPPAQPVSEAEPVAPAEPENVVYCRVYSEALNQWLVTISPDGVCRTDKASRIGPRVVFHGPPEGVLLDGNPSDPAMDAVVDLHPKMVNGSEILESVILSRLTVWIARNATVSEINQALLDIDARIVSMRLGSNGMSLAIPKEATIDAVNQVANQLAVSPAILFAFPAVIASPKLLPPEHEDPGPVRDTIQHLMPTRFPAAWNAAELIEFDDDGECVYPVTVLVADEWMNPDDIDPQLGPYMLAAKDQFELDDTTFFNMGKLFSDIELGDGDLHGYDVMSTMAAKFDVKPPTGAMPVIECLDFILVPVNGYSWFDTLWIIIANFPDTGKFLINLSLGFANDDANLPPELTNRIISPLRRALLAKEWRFLVRATDREDDFLVFTSAGNEADRPTDGSVYLGGIYPGAMNAAFDSPFNFAARGGALLELADDSAFWGGIGLYGDLTPTADQMQVLRAELVAEGLNRELSNTLVVGSTNNEESPYDIEELDFSDRGADVYAVGEELTNLPSNDTIQGTSFSAPQVAGLAAYLWLIAPDLRHAQVPAPITKQLIEQSAAPVVAGVDGDILNLIDAYLAALTFDLDPENIGVPVIQFGEAPVREAILDIDADEFFEEDDVKDFLWAFYDGDFLDPDTLQIEPTTRDYSRFDLNGDGFTGGISGGCDDGKAGSPPGCTERFDLDLLATPELMPVFDTNLTESLLLPSSLVTPTERIFNEEELTDLEILCYYTFSPLYYGDFVGQNALEARTWLTDCLDVETSIDVPLADVHFASTVQLEAKVHETDGPILVDSEHGVRGYFRWTSSNPDVAVVAYGGGMHVTGPGTVTIRASYGRSSTETTLTVPYEDPISDSVEVDFQWTWQEDTLPFGCKPPDNPSIDEHHWIEDDKVVFDGVVLPNSQSVSTVQDPAIVWERATGGWSTREGDPVEDAQPGDLILTDEAVGFGFALIDVDYVGSNGDGCWGGSYTVHYYESHVADDQWPLWELTQQAALPYTGGIDEALWVHITPPNQQQLNAGAIALNTTSSGAALMIEISDEIGPDAVNIEAVGPWAVQYLPALNPIDARENIVVILRQGDEFFEVDVDLTVIDDNGQRNLEVNELVGWRCNLGTGQTCAGRTYADVLVGSYVET